MRLSRPADAFRNQSGALGYPQIVGLVLAFSLVLAIVVCCFVLTRGKTEPLTPLLLATGEWAPYSGAMLPSDGTAAAVVSAILEEMGYQPQFRFMPWSRAEQVTLENETDRGVRAAFPYFKTAERAANFYYSKAIARIELAIFYNRERNPQAAEIRRPSDLAKFYIVPIRGYQYPPETQKFIGGVPAVDTNLEAFRLLITSNQHLLVLEAVSVGNLVLAEQLASESDPIQIAPLRFATKIYVIASKRNPNNRSLIRQFNNTLKKATGLKQIEAQVADAIESQHTVRLQPIAPQGNIDAFVSEDRSMSVLLPQGTRAVVEHWSQSFLKPRPAGADPAELVRVRILNGPQRGQRYYVDERTVVLP